MFPQATFSVLTVGGSDNALILFHGSPKSPFLPGPFRYHGMWLRDKNYEEIILSRWAKPNNVNEKNIDFTLYLLGKDLTRWNKYCFRKVEEVIYQTRLELESIRRKEVNPTSVESEINLREKLEE